MSVKSRPDIFIIESLDRDNEENHLFEGKALDSILRMIGKVPEYRYIRTKKEFQLMAKEFRESDCRYLHISCHGNEHALKLTLDSVEFRDFAKIFSPALQNRRVFLSACSAAQPNLAQELYHDFDSAPYSVTGPSEPISFSDAAVIWASLYNLLFRDGASTIQGENVREQLSQVCRLFNVTFNYFGRDKSKPYFKSYELPQLAKR